MTVTDERRRDEKKLKRSEWINTLVLETIAIAVGEML